MKQSALCFRHSLYLIILALEVVGILL